MRTRKYAAVDVARIHVEILEQSEDTLMKREAIRISAQRIPVAARIPTTNSRTLMRRRNGKVDRGADHAGK